MKYRVACFTYDLPESSCVFCQKAELRWDFSGGIYMVLCPEYKIISKQRFIEGCNKRIPYPEGTDFTK